MCIYTHVKLIYLLFRVNFTNANKTKICSSVFPLKLKDNKQAQTNSLLESTNTLLFVFHLIKKQPQKELAINSTSKQKRH